MKKVAVVAALAAALALVLASCANSSGGDDDKKKGNALVLSGTTWESSHQGQTTTVAFTSDTEVSITQLASGSGDPSTDTGTYAIAGTTVTMTFKVLGVVTATLNDAANPTSFVSVGGTFTRKP